MQPTPRLIPGAEIQTGIDQKSAPVPEVSTPLEVTTVIEAARLCDRVGVTVAVLTAAL